MAKLQIDPEQEARFQVWLSSAAAVSGELQQRLHIGSGDRIIELLRRAWWEGFQSGTSHGIKLAERESDIIRLQHKRTEV